MKIAVVILAVLGYCSASPAESRIVGGHHAEHGSAPYQAQLRWIADKSHLCGGTILNERWILTAAHCVEPGREFEIVVGITNRDKEEGDLYHVEKTIQHEEYDRHYVIHDIALVKVTQPIKFSKKVQPAKISEEYVKAGVKLRLTGWGMLNGQAKANPNELQEAYLSAISNEECMKELVYRRVYETNICTYVTKGIGACGGDSGGPLVLDNTVVGVVSWGIQPCAVGLPDVFTRVSSYIDWIQKTVAAN